MADEQQEKKEDLFAVYAVRKDESTPLIQTNLPFGRLMEDIVMPFESDDMFFIDGAPVKATDLDRIKIIRQKELFIRNFNDIHHGMHYGGDLKKQELYAKQYHIRLEALLRESGEDLTAQAVKAYRTVIKPKLRDYIPSEGDVPSEGDGACILVFIKKIKGTIGFIKTFLGSISFKLMSEWVDEWMSRDLIYQTQSKK